MIRFFLSSLISLIRRLYIKMRAHDPSLCRLDILKLTITSIYFIILLMLSYPSQDQHPSITLTCLEDFLKIQEIKCVRHLVVFTTKFNSGPRAC